MFLCCTSVCPSVLLLWWINVFINRPRHCPGDTQLSVAVVGIMTTQPFWRHGCPLTAAALSLPVSALTLSVLGGFAIRNDISRLPVILLQRSSTIFYVFNTLWWPAHSADKLENSRQVRVCAHSALPYIRSYISRQENIQEPRAALQSRRYVCGTTSFNIIVCHAVSTRHNQTVSWSAAAATIKRMLGVTATAIIDQ